MVYIYTFFLLPMLIIFAISMVVGVVMFCLDIWKWSKRPEKFTDIHEDLTSNNSSTENSVSENKSIDVDDIL